MSAGDDDKAGAGSGGGTSCDQAAGANVQTASDRKKQIRVFMEGGLNQNVSLGERSILAWELLASPPRVGHKVDFGWLIG